MNPEASKAFSEYLRVPFVDKGRNLQGWDCFGLYRFVLAERHGILLPSYTAAYDSAADASSARALMRYYPNHWAPVAPGEAREGDGVVFCIGGEPWHCGYVIEPGIMLHTRKGCGTAIENYTRLTWQKRFEGIYRCKL